MKPLSVAKRLAEAVNIYHIGPGQYGAPLLLWCLKQRGLKVVAIEKRRTKKAGKRS